MNEKLGDILVQQGVIDEEKLLAALSDQRAFGGKLGRTLVDLGYVSEEQLVRALSGQLGLPEIDLKSIEPTKDALSALPVDACERYGVFPVRLDRNDRVLQLATAEPDRDMLQEVAQIVQLTIEPLICSQSAIDRAVRAHYYGDTGEISAPLRPGVPLPEIPGTSSEPADLAAVSPDLSRHLDAIAELRTLVVRLERAMNAQSRAFRALVELLQNKGVLQRGELGARTAKAPRPSNE